MPMYAPVPDSLVVGPVLWVLAELVLLVGVFVTFTFSRLRISLWGELLVFLAGSAVITLLVAMGVVVGVILEVRPQVGRAAARRPPATSPAALDSEAYLGANRGLTWVVHRRERSDAGAFVLVGVDDRSDPYRGDTPPAHELPILAFRPTGGSRPDWVPPERWSGGEVRLTAPVAGAHLRSLEEANARIAGELGEGWRIASFHDAAGWRFWARGDLEPGTTSRFWVYIRDQPANPWSELTPRP